MAGTVCAALPTPQVLTGNVRVRPHDQFEDRRTSRGNVTQECLPPDVQLKLPLSDEWTHLDARVAADEPTGMSRALRTGLLTWSLHARLADPYSVYCTMAPLCFLQERDHA